MSKAGDLIEYSRNDDNIERLHEFLRDTAGDYFRIISEAVKDLSDEDIRELTDYLLYFLRKQGEAKMACNVSINKIKAFFLLFSKLSDDENADRILSYLEAIEGGWHNGRYYLSNRCLRYCLYDSQEYCKRASRISDTESASIQLGHIADIFFNDEFSPITLFVFSYCLASVHSSLLNIGGITAPYYLQIAVNRTSVVYQVLKEIMEICDVNLGLDTVCTQEGYSFRKCGYDHQVFYPTQSVAKDIDDLICNFKDCPVLISGHENERNYIALLREIANISKKKKALDMRDRFNILPVFVCPSIKSSFDNVFDIDLTGLEISDKYLKVIRENKQILASWVLKLVTDIDMGRPQHIGEIDKRTSIKGINPLTAIMSSYINKERQKYDYLTIDNAKNVGFLNFFFNRYLKTFQKLCTFPREEKFISFKVKGKPLEENIVYQVDMLVDAAGRSLARLHHRYLPAPTAIGIKNKAAMSLAKQIERHYKALKIYIRVIPSEVKKDRYIFTLDTLNDTKDTDVSKNAATVQRRLKKYEYFRLDLKDATSIKLVVAERPLKDNSLIEILQNKSFAESKLKIPYAMGFDDAGNICIKDIVEFPHLLLGGATLSGKSTALKSLLISIAYKHRTGNVNVLILDLLGKEASDFGMFNSQPFLSSPVITELNTARKAILMLYEEKIRRLKNENLSSMPYIVCVIDEFPRLYSDDISKEDVDKVKSAMNELLSSGRHAKIYLTLAAQNPVREDMKGSIANITARIALKCAHYQNSKTILGRAGAEKLIGRGQMIFDSASERDKMLQGAFISDEEIKELLAEIKSRFVQENKYPFKLNNLEAIPIPTELNTNAYRDSQKVHGRSDEDILLEAIMWSLPQKQIANSRIQREYQIGNNRAIRVLDQMEDMGLICELNGNLGWKVIPKCFDDMPVNALNYLKENGVDESKIRAVFGEQMQELDAQTDISEMRADEEDIQEKSIEPAVEILDMREQEDNDEPVLSRSKTKEHIKIDSEFVKNHSMRHKKRPPRYKQEIKP